MSKNSPLSDIPAGGVELEIRCLGMQRSGNHAVLNWILRQWSGSHLFFNDVAPEEPFDPSGLEEIIADPRPAPVLVIFSFEDRLLRSIAHRRFYPQRIVSGYTPRRTVDLLILRDPFNLFASRFRHGEVPGATTAYCTGQKPEDLWISHAREFVGETDFLKRQKIVVNYNTWCASAEYRCSVAEQLGLDFTDAGFDEVSAVGAGSSFDRQEFQSKASRMATDRRWVSFATDPRYLYLLRNAEMLRFAERLFELDCELQRFIDEELWPLARKYGAVYRWRRSAVDAVIAELRGAPFFPVLRSVIQGKTSKPD